MRLIDADALKERIAKSNSDGDEVERTWWFIDQAPTACEEGVRCKDCKWYYMDECINPYGLMNVTEESYCSWAKRRGEK